MNLHPFDRSARLAAAPMPRATSARQFLASTASSASKALATPAACLTMQLALHRMCCWGLASLGTAPPLHCPTLRAWSCWHAVCPCCVLRRHRRLDRRPHLPARPLPHVRHHPCLHHHHCRRDSHRPSYHHQYLHPPCTHPFRPPRLPGTSSVPIIRIRLCTCVFLRLCLLLAS